MAKEQKESKSKVRVFFAEVEGNDATIQNGLQSLANILVRSSQGFTRPMKPLAIAANGSNQKGKTGSHPIVDLEEQAEETSTDETLMEDEDLHITEARKETRPSKKPASYKLLDVNLRPEGKESLKDFYTSKKPSDQQEQVTVFVHYLNRILGIEGVGVDHLFTCFREVSIKSPTDISNVARNVERRKKWIDSSDINNIRILTPGENLVLHDLPRRKVPQKG